MNLHLSLATSSSTVPSLSSSSSSSASISWFSGIVRGSFDRSGSVKMVNNSTASTSEAFGPIAWKNQFRWVLFKYDPNPIQASHCLRGLADLFNNVVNITAGVLEERMMRSGLHTVPDIFCCCCGQIVGLKYETAHEKSQKYKEGKFVLERRRIVVVEIDISP